MPEGLSPELAARWQEVADFASKIDTMTYFEMLDVPASMKASDITNAYFTMVKRWHPDRLPKELAPLKPSADVIFRNLTKAKDTLTDPEERTVYQRNVEAGGGTPESERQVNAIIEAAMAVQRAEIMLKQRDWAGALTLAEEARELSPENGDCLAIIAWSKFQLQSCEPPYGEMLGLLKKSLELNENSQKAHFYRAKIFQRKGDEKKALAEFDKVIQINPRHTEAMREVRVANMRGSKKDGGGFLSKLFGGDSKGKGKGKGKKR